VADDLISWVEKTDVDGFNLSRTVTPQSIEDFIGFGRADLTGARGLQAQLSAWHLAREAVRRSRLLPLIAALGELWGSRERSPSNPQACSPFAVDAD
jgi:hypothetical protein